MAALLFNTLSILGQAYSVSRFSLVSRTSSKRHAVLSKETLHERSILIVGDIHGCYDELRDLLAVAKKAVDEGEIYLICVGDMLNKGPKSLEVLDYLRDLMNQKSASMVRGNHEENILKQYSQVCKDETYQYPRRYKYLEQFSPHDFAFISQLPYSISVPHLNILIVHAGLVPGVPLHEQCLDDLCQMRNVVTTVVFPWGHVRSALKKPERGVAWATEWTGPQHIYFGHDCRRGLQQQPFATGLDTGCVYGGELTGVLLRNMNGSYSEPQLLSVPARRQHYFGKVK